MVENIVKNYIYNINGVLIPLLVGFLLTPWLLSKLGTEKFGILSLVLVVIGYFSIFDFGVGRAATHRISYLRARHKFSYINGVIKASLYISILFGIFGSILLFFISWPLAFNWLGVSTSNQEEVFYCFVISALIIPFITMTTIIRGISEGMEKFGSINFYRLLMGVGNFIVPSLVLAAGGTLLEVVISLSIVRVGGFWLHYNLLFKLVAFNWSYKVKKWQYKWIINYGGWVGISSILSPLMNFFDRFLVSFFVGASLVAYYTVPMDLISRALLIPSAIIGVIFPRITFIINNDLDLLLNYLRKAGGYYFLFVILSTLGIVFFLNIFYPMWIGSEFSLMSKDVFLILILGFFINSIAFLPYSILQARGLVKDIAILHSVEVIFYLTMLSVFVYLWGVEGAAWAWVTRVGVDLIALIILLIFDYRKKKGEVI